MPWKDANSFIHLLLFLSTFFYKRCQVNAESRMKLDLSLKRLRNQQFKCCSSFWSQWKTGLHVEEKSSVVGAYALSIRKLHVAFLPPSRTWSKNSMNGFYNYNKMASTWIELWFGFEPLIYRKSSISVIEAERLYSITWLVFTVPGPICVYPTERR